MNDTCDVVTDASEALPAFCQSLEAILRQGLKKGLGNFGLADRDYWNVIQDLTKSKRVTVRPTPAISHVVTLVQQCNKVTTSLSRGRLFLRIALAKGVLTQAIQCLLDNGEFLKYWYKDFAMLVDYKERRVVMDILKSLKKKTYKFNVNNCGFLDETWILPDVQHFEFVPCAMLGLTLFSVANKCIIVDVKNKSAAEEKGIKAGDCLYELYGELMDERNTMRLGQIRRKNQGKPVLTTIIKGRFNDGRWFPPLYKRYSALCQAGRCQMMLPDPPDRGEDRDTCSPIPLSQNQFPVKYLGSADVGPRGNCSFVQDGIKKLMQSGSFKNIHYKLQLLERDITLTSSQTTDVVRYSYTETSSVALDDNNPRQFGFITGNTTCSFADNFKCHVFSCESVQMETGMSQQTFTCSKSVKETLEKCMKYIQS